MNEPLSKQEAAVSPARLGDTAIKADPKVQRERAKKRKYPTVDELIGISAFLSVEASGGDKGTNVKGVADVRY